jgi:hypothetical protein
MRRAFDMYSDDTDGQTFKYLNVFARNRELREVGGRTPEPCEEQARAVQP